MTKEEKYKLAKWAVNYALDKGARQSKVSVSNSRSNGIAVREKKIENLEQAIENSLTVYLYVDNKFSVHSTNRLDNRKELERFIREAIEATRFLAEDEYRSLPEPDLYYKGGGPELNTFDESFRSVSPQQKIDSAFEVEKEVLGRDERIVSVTASYDDGMNGTLMLTSNGFEGDRENTYYSLSASVSVKQGDARPSDYWYESALFHDELKNEGIGKKALERALKKLGQAKIESANMPMILENRLAGQSLGPLVQALNGSAIQQKNSFLIDMLGEKVGSEKLHLVDEPFIISGMGSRLFDNEGLALKKRTIFDRGVLKSYYIDTYYGKKLGMDPTSGSTTNLVLEPGNISLEEMIASLDRGILVTGFNGGNSNGSTGDFSYGIEGFLIEKGKINKAVSEMNISGNYLQLYKELAEVGNDVYEKSAWRTPSLLFNNVAFSGL
ncbi:MAG: TldD/PmbA family protein [Bacteroidales bacterium]|nr:TldD/PmbA family protein [Bacteroidales bacterium]